MHLIEIFLPVNDSEGRAFGSGKYDGVREFLARSAGEVYGSPATARDRVRRRLRLCAEIALEQSQRPSRPAENHLSSD